MNLSELAEARDFFPTLDHWQGFTELAARKNDLIAEFFAPATKDVRSHFKDNLPENWICEPWGDHRRDTRWYHGEFGPSGITLVYGWEYELILRLEDHTQFDAPGISNALTTPEFAPIRAAMMRCDPLSMSCRLLNEKRNFSFSSAFDGDVPVDELAWYAYYEQEKFVAQAIEKVERFLRSPEVVRLLEKLNRDFDRKINT